MRRRIREATRGLGVCWEEKVRVYNSVITGKSEPLPIESGDAINTWVPPIAQGKACQLYLFHFALFFVILFIYSSGYLSIYLFTYLYIYLSIYLFIIPIC